MAYDVFISAKSADYLHAREVFDFLRSTGLTVFLSDESLPELGSADYRKQIDRALDQAQHMVVVTSSVANVEAPWVEAKWGFFVGEKRSGRKKGNLITVAAGNLSPGDLPPSLRYYEVLPLDQSGLKKLIRYVSGPLPPTAPVVPSHQAPPPAKREAPKRDSPEYPAASDKTGAPKLRVPAGCRAAERTAAEPYLKSGWAQEVVHAATGMALRFIPPGTFTMGSPAEEAGRSAAEVQHRVTLTQGFYLGKCPVTQAQWERTMGANPSHFKGADLPVERVSWDDCQAFLKKLGSGARLPTEAEWEYACRAGTTGAFAGDLERMAWYDKNSGAKTHPVGQKQPNAWGLYDMHGNVWEWCSD